MGGSGEWVSASGMRISRAGIVIPFYRRVAYSPERGMDWWQSLETQSQSGSLNSAINLFTTGVWPGWSDWRVLEALGSLVSRGGIPQCVPTGATSVDPPSRREGAEGLGVGRTEAKVAQGGGEGKQWFRGWRVDNAEGHSPALGIASWHQWGSGHRVPRIPLQRSGRSLGTRKPHGMWESSKWARRRS